MSVHSLRRRAVLAAALVAPLALVVLPGSGEARNEARFERPRHHVVPFARRAVHYVLERNGEVFGRFAEASGLGSEHEVLEFREGGDDEVVRKLPGRLAYQDIVLKRGILADLSLWEWREQVEADFPSARSDLAVVMVGRRGEAIARWEFLNGWPSKISAPTASADGNEIALEEVTLVHEGMQRVQ